MRFDRYRGKALLVTFIYTRCPLPDYCILMSDNFKEVEERLRRNPELYAKTDLVSVSIDPEHDTPAVLAAYGRSLMPTETRFDHWQFVTGAPDKIREFAAFFGLSYEVDSGQIVHSLRTAVIDPRGNVVEVFKGNEWTPDDAVASLRKALE
jgi:protein SCO1/2